MIIPDINLLIYAHNSGSTEHNRAREWWQSLVTGPEQIGVPWVVVLGFVRLLSNPKLVSRPSKPKELLAIMSEILSLPSVKVAIPGTRHVEIMRRLFQESGGSGKLTTDVHLAALAIELGAKLASNDTDFSRFKKLNWINPLR